MTRSIRNGRKLLIGPNDPDPVMLMNADSASPIALVCEHAGQSVPEALQGLGLSPGDIDKHVGWDIGAGQVTSLLAQRISAPAAFQKYSRLVIDCNRPPKADDSAPAISHGVVVPGNADLSAMDHWHRVSEIFVPFQCAVDRIMNSAERKVVLSIHSFEPDLGAGLRPWDIGLLFRDDVSTSDHLKTAIETKYPSINVGMNQPYTIDDESDLFVPYHGEARNIRHVLIEIRNDHIRDTAGCEKWASLLFECINDVLPEFQ